MPNKNNVSTGNAGEYFAAGEIERHGFTVAVPMSNVQDFDILAINRESNKQIAVQVKTTGRKQKIWTLSKKSEKLAGKNIIYIFVSLNDLATPEYHIVPSSIVAETIKHDRQEWLHAKGKRGQEHNDNNIRKFSDCEDIYLNRWDYLN